MKISLSSPTYFSRILLLILAIGISSPRTSFALFDRGGNLGVGTRAMGLAGAFVAIADDPSASYWNPAGIAQLDLPYLTGSYGSLFNDKNHSLFFSFDYALKSDIHLGLSTNHLFFTDIPGSQEDQYTGSVAIPLMKLPDNRLFVGINFRYLYTDLGNGTGTAEGAAADLGFLYVKPLENKMRFSAGLVLTDISTSVRFDQTGVEQTIPPILTPGVAFMFDPYTTLAVDMPWTLSNDILLNEQNLRIRTGVEHWFLDGRLGFRAGFTSFLTLPGDFSVGASYRNPQWTIDYAYMGHSDNLGNSHRISASWLFDVGEGTIDSKPSIIESFVGDQKIYLRWDIPEGSHADGYLIYIRTDDEKDFHRAKQEPIQSKYCLLRGAKNGVRYHAYVTSYVDGKEKSSCNEWITTPRPMSDDAKHYYDQALSFMKDGKEASALYSLRKAEELDPNNYEIKDLLKRQQTSTHEGLVPEGDTN
jgi:hypothetical protein